MEHISFCITSYEIILINQLLKTFDELQVMNSSYWNQLLSILMKTIKWKPIKFILWESIKWITQMNYILWNHLNELILLKSVIENIWWITINESSYESYYENQLNEYYQKDFKKKKKKNDVAAKLLDKIESLRGCEYNLW